MRGTASWENGLTFAVGVEPLRLEPPCYLSGKPGLLDPALPAPVPFRGSSVTAGVHPPAATPQRLGFCLYRRPRYGPNFLLSGRPFPHSTCLLRDEPG